MDKVILKVLLVLTVMSNTYADQAMDSTLQGNRLYEQGSFNEAIDKYDQALVQAPQVAELEESKRPLEQQRGDHGENQRPEPVDTMLQENTVKEDLKESGKRHAWQHQKETCKDTEC